MGRTNTCIIFFAFGFRYVFVLYVTRGKRRKNFILGRDKGQVGHLLEYGTRNVRNLIYKNHELI